MRVGSARLPAFLSTDASTPEAAKRLGLDSWTEAARDGGFGLGCLICMRTFRAKMLCLMRSAFEATIA
jgi:hypothetical protein